LTKIGTIFIHITATYVWHGISSSFRHTYI